MADVKKLAEELTKLTVLEVNELKNVRYRAGCGSCRCSSRSGCQC